MLKLITRNLLILILVGILGLTSILPTSASPLQVLPAHSSHSKIMKPPVVPPKYQPMTTTVDVAVANTTDDCYVKQVNTGNWTLSTTAATLTYGYYVSNEYAGGAGYRFIMPAQIPAGSIVSKAYVTLTANANKSGNTANAAIHGELTTNPNAFINIANYQARRGTDVGGADNTSLTTNSVAWSAIPAWTTNTTYDSPSIVTVVQEICDLGAVDAIVLFLDDHLATSSTSAHRTSYSYDGSSTKAPVLHLEYSAPEPPTVTTISSANATNEGGIVTSNITFWGGDNATSRGVQYGTNTGNYTANVTEVCNSSGGVFTTTLTGLDAGTVYYSRAFAINGNGNGYGSELTLRTLSGAGNWPNWAAINTIIWDTGQEDANNSYIEDAASDLDTYLTQMGGKAFTVQTSDNGSQAVRLAVDATDARVASSNETYCMVNNADGVKIIGYSALGAMRGAYKLLDNLGVRWLYPTPAWDVVPASLAELVTGNTTYSAPAFIYKAINFVNTANTTSINNWARRNGIGGPGSYAASETYASIYALSNNTTDPNSFLPNPMTSAWPWQLLGTSGNVTDAAKDYANAILTASDTVTFLGMVLSIHPSISPNDGGITGFNPPTKTYQEISDMVHPLANTVADNISAAYPDAKIVLQNYSAWANIPTDHVSANVLPVVILDDFTGCSSTIAERINAFSSYVATGMYDYTLDSPAYYDAPSTLNSSKVEGYRTYYNTNNATFTLEIEGTDNFGARGPRYWQVAKVMWDMTTPLATIGNDFLDKGFGTANITMALYYASSATTNSAILQRAGYLKTAMKDTTDVAVEARIRDLISFTYWMWYYWGKGYASLSLAGLQNLYVTTTKLRYRQLLTYGTIEAVLRARLIVLGMADGDVTALQDFVEPTASEVDAWLDEMLGGNKALFFAMD